MFLFYGEWADQLTSFFLNFWKRLEFFTTYLGYFHGYSNLIKLVVDANGASYSQEDG